MNVLWDLNAKGSKAVFDLAFFRDPAYPAAENSPLDYGVDQLQIRVDYAKTLKRRKVTPRTSYFATEYLNASENALAAEQDPSMSEDAKQELRERVHQFDKRMKCNESLWYIPNRAVQTFCDNISRPRKLEFYARYGDYLSRNVKFLKYATKEHEHLRQHQSVFKQYWTSIANIIGDERKMQQEDKKTWNIPTIDAVESCAFAMGIPSERIFGAIKEYGERDSLFQPDLDPLLYRGKHYNVAEMLSQDYQDLEALSQKGDDHASASMQSLILWIRDQLFTLRKGDEAWPGKWIPTDVIIKMRSQDVRRGPKVQRKSEECP